MSNRGVAVIGSVAIHVAAGAVLLASRSQAPIAHERPATALELVRADHAMPIDVSFVGAANAGGGGGTVRALAANERGADARVTAATRVARSERRSRARSDSSTGLRGSRERAVSDALGGLAIESRDSSTNGGTIGGAHGTGGDGGGSGGGHGAGRGRGVGFGDGAVVEQPRVATPVVPVAPKLSKARPAKLIYPRREGTVEDGKLFVARVTVDAEGFVVGATLLQGGGPYTGQAGGLIFRFRYLPALDDEGRPIRSTFDQPFGVQR